MYRCSVQIFHRRKKMHLASQVKTNKKKCNSLRIIITAESNATLFINNFLKKEGFHNISINFSRPKSTLQ